MVGIAHHYLYCVNCFLTQELMMNKKSNSSLSAETQRWLTAKGYKSTDLDQTGENGDTALMKATREGVFTVVEELINAGAEINARNNDGNNALWFACFGIH